MRCREVSLARVTGLHDRTDSCGDDEHVCENQTTIPDEGVARQTFGTLVPIGWDVPIIGICMGKASYH